jgi:hypothetical protein
MFIGLLDAQGKAIPPRMLSRVPAEIVTWSVECSENKIVFVNAKSLNMMAHETVHNTINKIGLFREAGDMKSFISPSDVREYSGVRKGDFMVLEPRALQFTFNFSSNQPDVVHLTDMIDNLTDQSLKHLHFIHDLAYTATGDLRILARKYLRKHGGFIGVR